MLHLLDQSARSGDGRTCLKTARDRLCPLLIAWILQYACNRLGEQGVGQLITCYHKATPRCSARAATPG